MLCYVTSRTWTLQGVLHPHDVLRDFILQWRICNLGLSFIGCWTSYVPYGRSAVQNHILHWRQMGTYQVMKGNLGPFTCILYQVVQDASVQVMYHSHIPAPLWHHVTPCLEATPLARGTALHLIPLLYHFLCSCPPYWPCEMCITSSSRKSLTENVNNRILCKREVESVEDISRIDSGVEHT